MSLRILVTYLSDDRLTGVPNIRIDVDTGSIYVNGNLILDDLESRLLMKLTNATLRLYDIYEDLQKEKGGVR